MNYTVYELYVYELHCPLGSVEDAQESTPLGTMAGSPAVHGESPREEEEERGSSQGCRSLEFCAGV